MKRILKVVLLATLIIVAMTGCVKNEINISLNTDGSGSITYSTYVDKSFYDWAIKNGIDVDDEVGNLVEYSEKSNVTFDGKEYLKYAEESQDFQYLDEVFNIYNEGEYIYGYTYYKDTKQYIDITGYIKDLSEINSGIDDYITELNELGYSGYSGQIENYKDIAEYVLTFEFPYGVESVESSDSVRYNIDKNKVTVRFGSNSSEIKFKVTGIMNNDCSSASKFYNIRAYDGRFTDIENSWYTVSIIDCYNKGIFEGISDNRFGTDENLTLAQILTLVARMHAIYNGIDAKFIKAGSADNWYQPYLDYTMGIPGLERYSSQNVDRFVSRGEIAYIINCALDLGSTNDVSEYLDVDDATEFYEEIVNVTNNGIMSGVGNNKFNPTDYITRAQMATIISRITEMDF